MSDESGITDKLAIQEDFDKLDKVIDTLDSVFGNYDDDGGDWRLYDQLQRIIDRSNFTADSKDNLRTVQKKIREAYLLLKDEKELLQMFD